MAGEKATVERAQADLTSRRRRPSGEPAPLPKEPLAGLGWLWVLSLVIVLALFALLLSPTNFFLGRGAWWNSFDAPITDWFVSIRNGALTRVADLLDALRNDWTLAVLRWATVAVLIVTTRWRHLFTFIFVVLGTEVMAIGLANLLSRPRPDGVKILADWTGFAAPSLAGAAVAGTLVAMVYALVVSGTWRTRALWGVTVVVVAFGLARVYLAVDRVTDVASAEILAVAVAVLAFRLITPDAVFPVSYAGGKTAHLDLSDTRVSAIVVALRQQLGLVVDNIGLWTCGATCGNIADCCQARRGGQNLHRSRTARYGEGCGTAGQRGKQATARQRPHDHRSDSRPFPPPLPNRTRPSHPAPALVWVREMVVFPLFVPRECPSRLVAAICNG